MDRTISRTRPVLLLATATLILFLPSRSAIVASDQWNLNPGSADWNTATNWLGSTVPNSSGDTATFDVSNVTGISLSANVVLAGVVFNSGASAYTITANSRTLDFRGAGVTNNSSSTQNFTTSSAITFHNSASAGSQTIFRNLAGGSTQFYGTSSGGNARLINDDPTAFIDISGLTNGGTTVGSIVGGGALFLGGNELHVGGDNTSTTFSGVIQDGGLAGGSLGSLIKTGTGMLTLSGANTYGGDTRVEDGVLNVTGSITNATGFFFVGYLSGSGTLNASAGGTISNYNGIIGEAGGTGQVTIDGVGSAWANIGSLTIGNDGTGTVNIYNGGSLSCDDSIIGNFGNGTVMVDGMGSTWTNTGTLTVGNGTGAIGMMNITAGGTVSNTDAIIGNNATGMVTVDGATSTWTNNGSLDVGLAGPGSMLSITNGGTVSANTTTIWENGTVLDNAFLTSPSVSVLSGGLLKGNGLVTGDVTNEGTILPGDTSPGTLHLMGNYVQNTGGTLSIQIGSLAFYSQLQVSLTATLEGTLLVTLNGYTGNAGDVFTILTSSLLSGNFTAINVPTLPNGLFFTESTDDNNVYLTVNSFTSAVPEPSTWVAGVLSTGALLASLWRRRSARVSLRR